MPRIKMSDRLNNASKLASVDTTGYKEMWLDAEKITPSDDNFYPLSEIEELADDMLERGQLQPLLIGRVDGKDILAVGHRRLAAILLNNKRGHVTRAWCFAKEMDQIEFMLTLISANAFTRKMDDITLLEQAKKMNYWTQKAVESGRIKLTGKKRDFVADKLNVSPTKMAQVNKINSSLTEEGIQALNEGRMNFSKAYETARLPAEKQRMVIEDETLLSADVRNMVQEMNITCTMSESDTDLEETQEQQEAILTDRIQLPVNDDAVQEPAEKSGSRLEYRFGFDEIAAYVESFGLDHERDMLRKVYKSHDTPEAVILKYEAVVRGYELILEKLQEKGG